MKKVIIKFCGLSLLLSLNCSINVQSDDIPNYCHDLETNAHWQDLKTRAANNFEVVNLANIRETLCQQVDDGELTVEEATVLFEVERERVVSDLKGSNH